MTAGDFPTGTDVLVVGAGPTGLALATSLRRLGTDVTIIDLGTEIRTDSRAAGVQPRTLTDLDRIGAAAPLIARGLKGTGFRVTNKDGVLDLPYGDLDTPYPFLLQVPQSETEQVLRDALTQAGIAFEGRRRPQEYALADVRMTEPTTTEPTGTPRVRFTFSPDGMLLQSPLPDGIVRVVASVPGRTGTPDKAGVQDLNDRRCGPAERATVAEIVRSTPYQVTSWLAATFAQGQLTSVAELSDPTEMKLRDEVLARIRDLPDLAPFLARRLVQLDVPQADWPGQN